MLKNYISNFKYLLIIILFLTILYYLISKSTDEIGILLTMGYLEVISLLIICWIGIILGASLNYIYYQKFSIEIQYKEAIAIFVSRLFLNFLPLRSGSIGTAIYLKNRNNINYQTQIVLFGAIAFIGFIAQLIIGLSLSVYLILQNQLSNYYIAILFGLICLFSIGILFFFDKIEDFIPDFIKQKFDYSLKGLKSITNDSKVIFITITYYIISIVLGSIKIYLFVKYLNYNYSFTQITLLVTITNISNLFSITPGNLGLKEIFSGIILTQFGGEFNQGFLLSIADRSVDVIASAILWLIFSRNIMIKSKKT